MDAWSRIAVFSVQVGLLRKHPHHSCDHTHFLEFLRCVWKKTLVSVIQTRRAFPLGLGAAFVWDVSLPVGSVDLPVTQGEVQT